MEDNLSNDNRYKFGVYQIYCKANNKKYIGSTVMHFQRRKTCHDSDLKHNRHHNVILQNAYNKYGDDAFYFEVLKICNSKNDARINEQHLIELFVRSHL